jgi:hypothetical protein
MPRLTDVTGQYFPDGVLLASAGQIRGLTAIDKFGINTAIGCGTEEDIWANGGTITLLTSAETIDVSSSSCNDTSVCGLGARTVTIEGLDNNFLEQKEMICLTGATPVTTNKSFIRINRAYVECVGSGGVNAGNITLTPTCTCAAVQAYIGACLGQTEKTQYTVPANKTLYLSGFFANVAQGDKAVIKILTRENGKSWRVKRQLNIYQNHMRVNLTSYIKLVGKSDIKMTGINTAAAISVSAGWDAYLIQG